LTMYVSARLMTKFSQVHSVFKLPISIS
jgi:hypothetical protein